MSLFTNEWFALKDYINNFKLRLYKLIKLYIWRKTILSHQISNHWDSAKWRGHLWQFTISNLQTRTLSLMELAPAFTGRPAKCRFLGHNCRWSFCLYFCCFIFVFQIQRLYSKNDSKVFMNPSLFCFLFDTGIACFAAEKTEE